MKQNSYIAEGYHAVIPALAFQGAQAAIEWYKKIFNAVEKMRIEMPDKTIAHAEISIDDCVIMISEENPEYNASPKTLGGNSINLFIYVPDVDAVISKAVEQGATMTMAPADQFYGDRSGRIVDPFGYRWIVSTHVRDVSEDEMKKAMDQMMQANAN